MGIGPLEGALGEQRLPFQLTLQWEVASTLGGENTCPNGKGGPGSLPQRPFFFFFYAIF